MVHIQSNEEFLSTAREWLAATGELLIVSHAGAGDRDYLFCNSDDDIQWFCDHAAHGYENFSVCCFADRKLLLRGHVDDEFIHFAIKSFPDNNETLVLRLNPFRLRLLGGNYCDNHKELRTELDDLKGCEVALGLLDDWDDLDVRVPNEKRFISAGVHRSH